MSHTGVIEPKKPIHEDWEHTSQMMQKLLRVKKTISRIECYDISNIQGKQAVGSMVVFVDGNPDRGQYKKFKIK
jgi:excinuclease ABC subunit C